MKKYTIRQRQQLGIMSVENAFLVKHALQLTDPQVLDISIAMLDQVRQLLDECEADSECVDAVKHAEAHLLALRWENDDASPDNT